MNDLDFLKLAVDKAKESVNQGGFPAGAVIINNGEIISEGISIGRKLNDPTGHAETSSIRAACKKLETRDLSGATLYASLQPCLMCFTVSNWANISRIVFGCRKTEEMVRNNYYEGSTDIRVINKQNNKQIEIIFISDYENEMLKLIEDWESKLP
jgi:tRNA(Arg) A34 adenosine deaminase TadA